MPEETTPAATAETTPAPTAGENGAFAKMRIELDAERKAKNDLDVRLKELERKDMDDKQRLEAEKADLAKQVADLAPIRDEHGRYAAKFETLYNTELAAIPDEKREAVQRLSQAGTWADRYESLLNAKTLLPAPTVTAGTMTQPTSGSAQSNGNATPETVQPLTREQLAKIDITSTFGFKKASSLPAPGTPPEQR